MLSAPRVGQAVELRYRPGLRPLAPYHGCRGRVVISGRGKPRNHLVALEDGSTELAEVGTEVVVPAGHLFKAGAGRGKGMDIRGS